MGSEEGPTDSEKPSDGEASADEAQAGMEEDAGALQCVPVCRAYRRKPPRTALHVLQLLRRCTYGCGAMLYPEEGTVCCSKGTHILGPAFNPPIDPDYMDFLMLPHVSQDSRLLNSALAMGSQGVFPNKAMGGVGFVQHSYGHVFLMGKVYLVMRPLRENNAFDTYLLPDHLLVDGATKDLGSDYGERLLRARTYLAAHHPLASRLKAIAEVPGAQIDLDPIMRIEAHSLRTSAMELAYVSSGVQGQQAEDRVNKVVYFDMRLHQQGLTPVTVDRHNALYDLLMFPLLHEKGVGGYFYGKDGSSVESTTGVKLSLQQYARAMVFQNPRLHHLGRLAQEYALVQHSRQVEDTLNFQRFGGLQAKLKRRRDVNPREGQQGAGSRVALTASVVGSFK